MNATITLREYLKKGKEFRIPGYQRGYVWGKKRSGDAKDSVSFMLESILVGYKNGTSIFIQGITVSESDNDIIIVDGQQRTTFFYLLLKHLGYDGKFSISYDIRKESNEFLSKVDILENYNDNPDEKYQDIYFFKKTLRLIDEELKDKIDKSKFLTYVLDYVKFLYIVIPGKKAITVFTMMNGNKAEMKQEELIKAELLRLASLNVADIENDHERNAVEWDNNMLRSRYAREWDKWLQWWKREDVRKLFKLENRSMGLLITTYQQLNGQELSFVRFRNAFLKGQKSIEAKKTFDGLRRLQKRFEDAFNDAVTYNKIGAIIRVCSDKKAFIKWYFCGQTSVANDKDPYILGVMPTNKELDQYYKWTFLGLSHPQIIKKDKNLFREKFDDICDKLGGDNLYNDDAEEAFRLLLRLNIDEDNLQEDGKGRKFDFSIWDRNDSRGRSLEHIYPKSKVWHKRKVGDKEIFYDGNDEEIREEDTKALGMMERDECKCDDGKASEHSIGNLVLLYKDDNSSFNNSSFEEKKNMFFKNPNEAGKEVKTIFKSRHLLHTIYKFAQSKWTGEDIARNKYITLEKIKDYYKDYYDGE